MDIVLEAHSGLRWLVLVGLAAVAIWALGRGRQPVPPWPRWVGYVFILQVALGLILWVANQGWAMGWFIAWWHPIAMIAALGAFQVGMARASREERPRTLGLFTIVSILLIVLAIPWQRGLM